MDVIATTTIIAQQEEVADEEQQHEEETAQQEVQKYKQSLISIIDTKQLEIAALDAIYNNKTYRQAAMNSEGIVQFSPNQVRR